MAGKKKDSLMQKESIKSHYASLQNHLQTWWFKEQTFFLKRTNQ